MKCLLRGLVLLGLVVQSGLLFAQDEVKNNKKQGVLLGIGANSSGISLSYDRLAYASNKNRTYLQGFVGYGFNASNWSDKGDITKPNAYPGASWRLSTYRPFDDSESNRVFYYLGDLQQYTVGVGIVDMLGKKNHFFELRVGIALDYFSRRVNFYGHSDELGKNPSYDRLMSVKGSRFASHTYWSIGYRFIANTGFTACIGLNRVYLQGPFTYFYAAKKDITPTLSVGYMF